MDEELGDWDGGFREGLLHLPLRCGFAAHSARNPIKLRGGC